MKTRSQNRHTPGPWRIADEDNENIMGGGVSISILDGNDFPVGEADYMPILHNWDKKYPKLHHWGNGGDKTHFQRDDDEVLANAKLIAAAPEMLEALKKWQQGVGHFYSCIDFKKTFLDGEAIQWMNDIELTINAVISKAEKCSDKE